MKGFVNTKGMTYFVILGKFFFLENKKVVNRKLGNFRNAILRFFISEFSVLYYSQSRKLGFRKLEKKKKNSEVSEISEVFEFLA